MHPLGIVCDPIFKEHYTAPGHPERPERLDAVRAGLEWSGVLAHAHAIEAVAIDETIVSALHTPAYLRRLQAACAAGQPFIDEPDSSICGASWEVALRAAGGVVNAARAIGRGEVQRAFCAVRPPGHHCERDRSRGFCLLNNIALAAHVLRTEIGLAPVAIVDFDVHHGNGTQHLFEDDPSVLFVSLHGDPARLYPGSGFADERGIGAGQGFTLNLPLAAGSDGQEGLDAFRGAALPVLEGFRPEAVLISAGFDAHHDDPIGILNWTEATYVHLTRELVAVADRHAAGRVLSVLEGGYNLEALRHSVAEHVHVLEG